MLIVDIREVCHDIPEPDHRGTGTKYLGKISWGMAAPPTLLWIQRLCYMEPILSEIERWGRVGLSHSGVLDAMASFG